MNVEIGIFAAALLWVPGAALLRSSGLSVADRATKIALQLALGLALWPLIFLWTSFVPLRWAPWSVRSIVVLAAAIAFFRNGLPRFVRPVTFHAPLLFLVVAVTAWTRLREIAGIVLPPWVDSVHHTMLVRLFLLRGGVPASYEPFIPGAAAYYHWGYHAIAAALCWLIGLRDPFSIATLILSLGQFLNALAPLFVYAAALALVRSRAAAVIAAALAGLVSYYPAYYVSWGRYTHLTGILLLLAWITIAARLRRPRPGAIAIAAVIASGLTLVHVRLAFFGVMFAVVWLSATLVGKWSAGKWSTRNPAGVPLIAAGALASILLAPWFIEMRHVAGTALAPSDTDTRWSSPAEVKTNLLWVPHAAQLLSAATAGLSGLANIGPLTATARVASFVWWLAVLYAASKRRRARPLLAMYAVLGAWCVLSLLTLRLTHLQFATATSAAISAFVPTCIAAGALIAWVTMRLGKPAMVLVLALAIVIGIATLRSVINPATVIAAEGDVGALRWLRDATPATTAVIGRVEPWYGGAFVGIDGAYWASVLTDRRSLPPPSLYGWTGSFAEMDLFLARWRDEYPFVTNATLAEARHLGITHVYFGRDVPEEAAKRVGAVVYARDGVRIAALP